MACNLGAEDTTAPVQHFLEHRAGRQWLAYPERARPRCRGQRHHVGGRDRHGGERYGVPKRRDHGSGQRCDRVRAPSSVTATASDNVGVAGVQFMLDGVDLGAEDTTRSVQRFLGHHDTASMARIP